MAPGKIETQENSTNQSIKSNKSLSNAPFTLPDIHAQKKYYPPEKMFAKHPSKPHLSGMREYQKLYEESISNPNQFWARLARESLVWQRDFETVYSGSFANGDSAWFLEGQLNASYNCLDRHVIQNPESPAIIYEADNPEEGRTLSYGEVLREVCKIAYVLKNMGVKKGDNVAIHLPMIPEAVIAMLACVRIGAIHTVIFIGFSPEALRNRIKNVNSRVLITTNEAIRGGKLSPTKEIVDGALEKCPGVTHCLVYCRTDAKTPWKTGRDFWWHEETEKWPSYIAPESMNSEDPLFILHTSGSTGMPKGILHTTAGFLLGAAATGKYVLDIHRSDKFFCAGDVGWITGHTYAVYAPLLLGAATVIFEGPHNYPTPSRLWDVILKHKVTHLYAGPYLLRTLKREGDHYIPDKLEDFRVMASGGEPVCGELWDWCFNTFGKREMQVLDTYGQTESGSHTFTPLAGVTPTKPGSVTFPFFGIKPALIDPNSGKEIHENNVEGVLVYSQPWPSMARSIWGAHNRYIKTYFNDFKGKFFTGDRATRDDEGYFWICGRVDESVIVSGILLPTSVIESSLTEHPAVTDAALVGVNDDVTGQAITIFLSISDRNENTRELKSDILRLAKRKLDLYPIPRAVYIVPELPKTRSGKIMRRILRKIVDGETDQLGDTTTLLNPSCIDVIVKTVQESNNDKLIEEIFDKY